MFEIHWAVGSLVHSVNQLCQSAEIPSEWVGLDKNCCEKVKNHTNFVKKKR